MTQAKLLLLVALFLASCASPATPAPTQTSTPQPPTSTFTPEPPTSTPTVTFTAGPPTNTPTSTPGIGSTWTSPIDNMEMVYVPAGSFLMGSSDADPLATSQEKPQHTVTLDAFWIDKTEVTQRMYALCVDRHVCHEPTVRRSNNRDWYWDNPEFLNYPVLYVNWPMAQTYCEWTGRRLPTEAEWEKAARGTDGRIYPWGNDPPNHELLNYDDWFTDVLNVGRYPDGASPYGAMEMAGNVREWVADWFSETYYQNSPASNPLGPDSGDKKVWRGGSFVRLRVESSDYMVRAAMRWGYFPALPASPDDTLGRSSAAGDLGFRCARSE